MSQLFPETLCVYVQRSNYVINYLGQKEWPKLKERFDLVSRKLHMNHNEYLLSIQALNEHNKHKETHLTPHLLDAVEDVEKRFLIPWYGFV